MKIFVRILSLLLCVLCLFAMVSCVQDAPDDAPDGMKLATVPNSDFRLYIPTSWNANTAYGISGGYATISTQSTVSMVKYPITEEMQAALPTTDPATRERIDWFYTTECRPALEALSLGGSFSEVEPAAEDLINKRNAFRYHETGIVNGKELHFVSVITETNQAFYVFSFTVDVSLYERLLPDVEAILDELIFADPYLPDDYLKPVDENAPAPEGMKLASNDEVPYLFYVPTSWTIDQDERIFAAFAEDGSVVSVVPYMPDGENMSTQQLFARSEELMKATAGENGYELFSHDENATLASRPADSYRYRYTVGGNEFYYLQVIVAYKSRLYNVTYTARPENFEANLTDVEAILSAFTFR